MTNYEAAQHRRDDTQFSDIQKGNQQWWTENTMSYDWKSAIAAPKYSKDWYDEIDRRFIYDSRLFAHGEKPFDQLIPFEKLAGKKVLEIGCGMGLHAELIARSGAELTCIDISETSVKSTKERLRLKELNANVIQHDAETLPFEDKHFDFVWSWGVIHHSSRTARIAREIARVLKDDGECRIMVYNRDGASAWRSIIKYHVLRFGALRGKSLDESLNRGTDGFHARHYSKDQFEDLFRAFFKDVDSSICGQVPDSLPLPRRVRWLAERFVTEGWLKAKQATRGSFLFLTATNTH